jgi:chromosome partitioning protein
MKGGVAKTTLAVNLADALVKRERKRVILIDVDPQFNATQCLISPETYIEHLGEGRDTILNIFERTARAKASAVSGKTSERSRDLAEIAPLTVKPGFDLLPGNLELYRLEMAPGGGRENRLKKYLEYLSEEDVYDFAIIDTPPTPSVWMTSALLASDFYLIPVRADPLSLTGIDLLHSVIEDKKDNFSLKIKCAGLVLTITEEHTRVFNDARRHIQSQSMWKSFLYKKSLPKRVEVAGAQGRQQLILDCNDPDVKQSLTSIATELLERIE